MPRATPWGYLWKFKNKILWTFLTSPPKREAQAKLGFTSAIKIKIVFFFSLCSPCTNFAPKKRAMRALDIIDKYYADNEALRELLIKHSKQVTERALKIAESHPELNIDKDFVEQAAMLHDVGIFLTDAPGIHCFGKEPYLMHGYLGGQLMRREGFPEIARVCERHTGTGLTDEVIKQRQLPLPAGDYRPETLEEQLICYADKFYSKSHPDRIRSVQDTARSLEKFGHEGVKIFWDWVQQFEPEALPAEHA